MVGVLAMVLAVGVLGTAILFASNQSQPVNLNIKAATDLTVSGILESNDPNGCGEQFYLGCLQLNGDDGKMYDVVEGEANMGLGNYVGQNVRVVGKTVEVNGINVLTVTSVSPL